MITGDHRDTAVAIAMELGIITDPSKRLPARNLDHISDKEFEKKITQYAVYARVQPEHKVRIVNAWKARGKITAHDRRRPSMTRPPSRALISAWAWASPALT